MERSIHVLLEQPAVSQPTNPYALFCNLLQVAASTVQFFLVPYFVLTLKLSVVQSGVLLSSYGLGVLAATYFKVSIHQPKMPVYALLCNILSLGNFLILTSFVPLILNVLLLGFGSALFKKNLSHSTYQQTKSLYWSSELGLTLALVGILVFPLIDFKMGIFTAFILSGLSLFLKYIDFQKNNTEFGLKLSFFFTLWAVIASKLSLRAEGEDPEGRHCEPKAKQSRRSISGCPYQDRPGLLHKPLFVPHFRTRSVKRFVRNDGLREDRLGLTITNQYFYLSLLFLGGLLLSQLTTTYGLYLATQFPDLSLKALAIFMLIHAFILCFLQKPIAFIFHRSDPLFRSGYGALLLGLGCFAFNLGHVFTVVVLSAMVYSLGEIFFIGALYKMCQENKVLPYFTRTLTGSLIVGASLGTYVYQYFGPRTLWQACALLGVLCFILGIVSMCLKNADSN